MARPLRYDPQKLRKAYEETGNMKEAALNMGIPYGTFRRYMNNLGIRPGSGNSSFDHTKIPLDLEEISKLYWVDGLSTLDIGLVMCVSDEVIRRKMTAAGVPRRSMLDSRPRGPKNNQWKGGHYRPGYRYQYRKKAAACLGRQLPQGWVVHHHNGNNTDHRIENLVLFQNNSDHLRFHQRLLESQLQAGSTLTIPMVLENGGCWLPKPRALPAWSHGKNTQDLWKILLLAPNFQPAL